MIEPGIEGTLVPERQVIRSPEAKLRGPVGVHIKLIANPSLKRSDDPELASGEVIRLRGSTTPPARSQRISLRYTGPGTGGQLVRLASVETDRRGRFRYHWRPKRLGSYELWAFYRRQQRNRTSDHICPALFSVR